MEGKSCGLVRWVTPLIDDQLFHSALTFLNSTSGYQFSSSSSSLEHSFACRYALLNDSIRLANFDGYTDSLISHRESEPEAVVFLDDGFGFLSLVFVVDVLFHDHGSVVIPMPVRSVVPVNMAVVVPFLFYPAIVMPMVRLVAALVIMVSLAVLVITRPNVASQCQCKSNQNDSNEDELPSHVNLLCDGLRSRRFRSV